MDEFEIPNIQNNEKQSNDNNKKDIIIKKSFQKNGYEKIIYKNLSKLKNKFIYGFKLPEIIINPSYINDGLNQNYTINYRERITNRELYRMKNIENEKNNESNEINNEIEERENNGQNSTMRLEFREEIISYRNNNNNNKDNNYYHNGSEYNNSNNNELNNPFYYKTQKPPIKYIIYKKRNHKKNKTFVSSPNYIKEREQKFKNSDKDDYNIKFPKEDIPLPIRPERESHNSCDDENIKTFKKDIENLNKYDKYKKIKNNNVFNNKFKNDSFGNNTNKTNK